MLNPDGTVYAATTTKYNALDQAVRVRQYAGAAPPQEPGAEGAGYQTTTMEYDGHGRLQSQLGPAQTRPVTYQYNADDTLWKVLTPREPEGGASRDVTTTFTYNNRHLVTRAEYTAPAGLADVPANDPVEFDYDGAGNRLWMTDGSGRTEYEYDALSRLRVERRQFRGLEGKTYKLSYGYNLAGELRSVTQDGSTIEYKYDAAGQLEEVSGTGTLYAGVSSYAGAIRYRAWGAVRAMSYGNGLKLTAKYNSRLLPEEFTVDGKPAFYANREAIHKQYRYHADGRLYVSDDRIDDNFDRMTTYDQAGRLATAAAGSAVSVAANGTPGNAQFDPYRQTYGYDAWGNLTGRDGVYWNQGEHPEAYRAAYDNHNREAGVPYDAAGNALQGPEGGYRYDAAGRNREVVSGGLVISHTHDGDGAVARRVVTQSFPAQATATYYLRSSALGGAVVAEFDAQGQRAKGYVWGGGELLAEQAGGRVVWRHADPHGGSLTQWDQSLNFVSQAESDPTGVDVGAENPFGGGGTASLESERVNLVPNDPSGKCRHNGIPIQCARVGKMLAADSAVLAPEEEYRVLRFRNRWTGEVRGVLGRYSPEAGGYLPVGVNYAFSHRQEYAFRFGDGAWGFGSVAGTQQAGGGRAFSYPVIAPVGVGLPGPQEPTKPDPNRSEGFIRCANDSNLGWMLTNPNFNDQSAIFINQLANAEGVDAGLLGFTMQHEGASLNPPINKNGSDDPSNWDVGPFQLNVAQTYKDIQKGDYNDGGLEIRRALGAPFGENVDAFENGRLAARKLKFLLNGARGDFALAAGRYYSWTKSKTAVRKKEWENEGNAFQAFYRCFTAR